MPSVGRVLSTLIASVIGIAVMVILATIVFFITVFVVTTGAQFAGQNPSSDFVVLASALIVVAVILTGGLTPRLSTRDELVTEASRDAHDPTYD